MKGRIVTALILSFSVLTLAGCNPDAQGGSDRPAAPSDISGQASLLEPAVDTSGRTEQLVTGGFISWNFEKDTEGFHSPAAGAVEFQDGMLRWQAGSGKLLSPGDLNIQTQAVRTVELRLYSTAADCLTVRWASGEASIPLVPDGKTHDYQIELSQIDEWDGVVPALEFEASEGEIYIEHIRLSGLYFVPFPFLTGKLDGDVKLLTEIKDTFRDADKSVIIGFSATVEYLSNVNEDGNYTYYHDEKENYGTYNPYYLVSLAKAAEMPVMLWLRGDPWGYSQYGAYGELYKDDKNLMWTADLTENPAYRNNLTGYAYLSLAQKNLDGSEPAYWLETDRLLGQCAEEIDKLIKANPNYILGVTTTSEYKYNTENQIGDLDYNPKTIAEFRDWCRNKYGTTEALNAACDSDIAVWELRSDDFDPGTVETPTGLTRRAPAASRKSFGMNGRRSVRSSLPGR